MSGSQYQVQAGSFEGPFDVLLSLVEKRKMHVSDVSLAAITDEYVRFIETNPLPVAHTAEFILVASTLMLIKSRSLLPGFAITRDEAGDIKDLEDRLARYQVAKERARILGELIENGSRLFTRSVAPKTREISFNPSLDGTTLKRELVGALGNLLALLPTTEKIPQATVKKMISLEEVITSLRDRLTRAFRTTLNEFAGTERAALITGFLAMLELVKQGDADVHQSNHFDDIWIETRTFGVPRYD